MQTIVITPPGRLKDEAVICNNLFARGMPLLHLRKPGADRETYERFILQIEPRYRQRIVIHGHYGLAGKYRLHGIHLKPDGTTEHARYPDMAVSVSCHSLEEIRALPFRPAYCFLSPVFDSISKQGYTSRFDPLPDVSGMPVPVIALGGITPEAVDRCRAAGFRGVAALGYIWSHPDEAVARYLRLSTPFVMSIAGFDPSSGAGVTADLKTFEATGSYGLGVCSALTFQNEDTYEDTLWHSAEEIKRQCTLQFRKHRPEYIKIGLVRDFALLEELTGFLAASCPGVRLIWDPILKASAGKVFHEADERTLASVFGRLYLLTPNTDEVYRLFGKGTTPESLREICRIYRFNILWKGGHDTGKLSSDCLVTPSDIRRFSVVRSRYGKHGTGCVLSAALTSLLARGDGLSAACGKAQLYTSRLIDSNDGNLGFHSIAEAGMQEKPSPLDLKLQYITAPKNDVSLAEQVEAVCRGGVRWIQLRMKETAFAEILKEGKLIAEICRRYHALLIVNDHVGIARQLDADGVHLGKDDGDPLEARRILGPGKIIGATCNSWEDILLRQRQAVDYIGLGPYAFTETKKKLSPILGLKGYALLLNRMKECRISLPVFAIGGITEADIPPLMQTGVQGIALSGLLKNSRDITAKTREVVSLTNSMPSPLA